MTIDSAFARILDTLKHPHDRARVYTCGLCLWRWASFRSARDPSYRPVRCPRCWSPNWHRERDSGGRLVDDGRLKRA